MKTKKAAMELSMSAIIILVLAMSMLIIGLVIVKSIFNKPEFVITKEECWNETNNIVIRNISEEGTEIINYNIRFNPKEEMTTWDIEDEFLIRGLQSTNEKEYGYVRFIELVNATYFDYDSGLEKQFFGLLDQEKYPLHKLTEYEKEFELQQIINPSEYWIDTTFNFSVFYRTYDVSYEKETKEVCEQVEVDKIEIEKLVWIGNECIDGYPNGKKYDSLGEEEQKCKVIDGNTYLINIKDIAKQDLSIEWLETNARCIECIGTQEDENTGETLEPLCCDKFQRTCLKVSECQKYKFEEYEIEVK